MPVTIPEGTATIDLQVRNMFRCAGMKSRSNQIEFSLQNF
ncbi:MAG: hypothetical protein OJF59_000912 [Cytophagales bacterium]|nr:MAG: hypothetical protein OJF59_000912 [Cytophagales bacterium]